MPRLMLKYFLLAKWASPESQGQSYIKGNSFLDAYCATLSCNQLRERFPEHNHAPGLTDATFLLSTEDLELIEYECLTEHQRGYVEEPRSLFYGSAFL